jgi:hypothetical protein
MFFGFRMEVFAFAFDAALKIRRCFKVNRNNGSSRTTLTVCLAGIFIIFCRITALDKQAFDECAK